MALARSCKFLSTNRANNEQTTTTTTTTLELASYRFPFDAPPIHQPEFVVVFFFLFLLVSLFTFEL
ncbi:MAG: hypothetical protein N6V41_01600, partial [Candidatus Portiera aleyrodidarum]|nr:hypothetical protein [Candidatus Portiera aleyrodidarum]